MFNHGSLAASREFECVNSSRPSLLTAKMFCWLCSCEIWMQPHFQCTERVENPFQLSGKPVVHQWAIRGWNWLCEGPWGELGCQWKAFKEVDKAGCTHVWSTIVFYTPLQTELNLSSLPIIRLFNSPFHLIPVVLHVTSGYTESVTSAWRGACVKLSSFPV